MPALKSKHVVKNPITPKVRPTISAIARELQALQRQRAVAVKSRIMMANRLQAIVAGTLGFDSSMPEKERLKVFSKAAIMIKQVHEGKVESPMRRLIGEHMKGIVALEEWQGEIEKEMRRQAKVLPIVSWVEDEKQRGFGLLFLAIVIGETGDLGNYANPGKVWRRLGCAPWTFEDKTLMGATWRSGKEGKLPAAEWESFGYSPRRRSIAFLIGEGIVKQNGGAGADEIGHEADYTLVRACGPYRKRYDESKAAIKKAHPDYSDIRCHRHGMLLATKLLLKNLWCEWNR